MEIVIDIPEWKYKSICKGVEASKRCGVVGIDPEIHKAIYNGTPLPKEHGRLIDADETLKAMDTWDKFGYVGDGWCVRNPGDDYIPYVYYGDMVRAVSGMPTIIEADKESKNESSI